MKPKNLGIKKKPRQFLDFRVKYETRNFLEQKRDQGNLKIKKTKK